MAWTVHLRGRAIPALTDATDRAWIPVAAVAEALGLHVRIDQPAAAIYLTEPYPLPPLPGEPVGANVPPWLPVDARITSAPGDRHPGLYDLVIRQFRVFSNPRYAVRDTSGDGIPDTHCDAFVWDVTRAMGCEIPGGAVDAAGNPAPVGSPGSLELGANGMIRWLRQHGPRYGWREVMQSEAARHARAGRPAVVTWYAEAPPYIGHMAMIRPAARHTERGVAIAQAGAVNCDDCFLADGFGGRGPLQWWNHD